MCLVFKYLLSCNIINNMSCVVKYVGTITTPMPESCASAEEINHYTVIT